MIPQRNLSLNLYRCFIFACFGLDLTLLYYPKNPPCSTPHTPLQRAALPGRLIFFPDRSVATRTGQSTHAHSQRYLHSQRFPDSFREGHHHPG